MEFKIVKNFRSKRLRLRVTLEGQIIVSAPTRCSKKECNDFVAVHNTWISNVLEKINAKNAELQEYKKSLDGKVYYLGQILPLNINPHQKQKYLIQDGQVISKNGDKEVFYRQEAKKIFETKCAEIAPFYGAKYSKIRINSAKSRWGSCSSSGTLSFNYNLIKAPKSIVEYVIIHEICHILQPNHSSLYWNEVAKLCSDFKVRRQWLKENGWKLTC